jgi:ribonuclease HI
MKKLTLYTDGACSGNPGPGGWGAILIYGDHQRELNGGETPTTNNRMEMMAVIEGLRALKNPCEVTIFTDSKYVLQGMTEWRFNWIKKGWKTADNKPVKNADLWQILVELDKTHTLTWQWVKGHNGDPMNERADTLAREGINKSTNNQNLI